MRTLYLSTILTLAALPSGAHSADAKSALDGAFAIVQEAVAQGEVPGAVALVSQRGQIIREEAFGLAE